MIALGSTHDQACLSQYITHLFEILQLDNNIAQKKQSLQNDSRKKNLNPAQTRDKKTS
jgi:hypothetical protein